MRGGAVVILAALVGAWALGLADAEEKEKTPPNVVQPADDPDDGPSYDIKGSDAVKKAKEQRTRDADPTQDAGIQSIADTGDDPTDSVASDPTTPTGADPTTPASPDPSWDPDDPTHTPNPPSNPPSNPPTEPEEECTDLASTLNCVIDGVLGGGRP